MKIVLVGGHLAPALGVIDALSSKDSVAFIGRKYALEGDTTLSLEYQEITKRNIPFLPLSAGRFQRSFTAQTIPSLSRMPSGAFQAIQCLRRERPDVVLSFGGYLSVPVGLAAIFLRIPLVIHEQTLQVGLANKLLSQVAAKVCISWENSRAFFPQDKVVLTGNPLKKFKRTVFKSPFAKSDEKLPLLYITGGSTGSHAINLLIESSLLELTKSFRVIHQTGDTKEFQDYERLVVSKEKLPKENGQRYVVKKYITSEDIGGILESANIVMSRSGMNTVTELIYFGKPALLIPLPHGQKGEQLKNAHFLEKLGLAKVLPQTEANADAVTTTLHEMVKNLESYKSAVKKAQKTLHSDAAKEILDTLSYVVQKKST